MIDPQTPIENIPKINPKYRGVLEKLGIKNVRDLLFHFPFRYEDYSQISPISEIIPGQQATVIGKITSLDARRSWKKRRMQITQAVIEDESGTVEAVWFNQRYLAGSLEIGKELRLSGKVSQTKNGLSLSNPAWEFSSRDATHTGRLVPIYPETEGITSRWIRWQIANVFQKDFEIEDPLPRELLENLNLYPLKKSLQFIHFPRTEKEFQIAQKRFAFEEMLFLQIRSLQIRSHWEKETAVPIESDKKATEDFVAKLPFRLTGAQEKAVSQISEDLKKSHPMNRLLNGDVGSGKTIVAAIASLQVAQGGHQVAIMAPTEVLALQHFLTLSKIFKSHKINIALLTNSYKEVDNFEFRISNLESNQNEECLKIETLKIHSKFKIKNSKLQDSNSIDISRVELLSKLKSGDVDLVIGTHALIQKDVRFKNLALVIVDEQHRFGVTQRAYLQQEVENINDGLPGKTPHLLSMTATPIPRTLTMAFFGNLDISVLDEMPKNRKTIITKISGAVQREAVYDFVREEIGKVRQAFIIFPLVEESEAMKEIKAATNEHVRLSEKIFPDLKLGLLHGRLKSEEKEKVMQDFKDKKFDILVATSVVEVGIDVPNATIIIIEDAERFGLSQLHQFRGRVGRGEHQSHCFLFGSSANERLKTMSKFSDGFSIAEKDLKLRGPGQFLGKRQSGLPDITMENIANIKLIEISRKSAEDILKNDPDLKKHPLLKKELDKMEKNLHLE